MSVLLQHLVNQLVSSVGHLCPSVTHTTFQLLRVIKMTVHTSMIQRCLQVLYNQYLMTILWCMNVWDKDVQCTLKGWIYSTEPDVTDEIPWIAAPGGVEGCAWGQLYFLSKRQSVPLVLVRSFKERKAENTDKILHSVIDQFESPKFGCTS